tara:strand:- start:31 stop:702 length:672 start_codon:yes stop_codon:yes gene_type:complete
MKHAIEQDVSRLSERLFDITKSYVDARLINCGAPVYLPLRSRTDEIAQAIVDYDIQALSKNLDRQDKDSVIYQQAVTELFGDEFMFNCEHVMRLCCSHCSIDYSDYLASREGFLLGRLEKMREQLVSRNEDALISMEAKVKGADVSLIRITEQRYALATDNLMTDVPGEFVEYISEVIEERFRKSLEKAPALTPPAEIDELEVDEQFSIESSGDAVESMMFRF